MDLAFHTFDIGSVCQWAAKLLAVKVGGLKKVCHPAQIKPHVLGLGLTSTRSESFSKFDGLQLCSPLNYRLYINFIERSKHVHIIKTRKDNLWRLATLSGC